MSEETKRLVKETWCDYFSGGKDAIEASLDREAIREYEDAMLRLETDFGLQRELGIGL